MRVVYEKLSIGIRNIFRMNNQDLSKIATDIRKQILEMIYKSQSSHIGSCFSIVDILAVLYFQQMNIDMNNPKSKSRDYFILSKGHAAAALYATLARRGFFPTENLDNFCCDHTKLAGHVIKQCLPGVETTAGSLGHGLSIGAGVALANLSNDRRIYCLIGDGECNEGSVWEAAMFASHNRLDNLILIIDVNRQQGMGNSKDIIDMRDLKKKWDAFGWDVCEIDGHDCGALSQTIEDLSSKKSGKPSVIIANTVKGKGVSFMEDNILWHYRSPDAKEYKTAKEELDKLYEKYGN